MGRWRVAVQTGAVVGIAERPSPSGCDQGRGGFGSRVGGHKFFVDEATRRGVDRCAGDMGEATVSTTGGCCLESDAERSWRAIPQSGVGDDGPILGALCSTLEEIGVSFTLGERPSGIGRGVGYDLAPCFASWSRGSHFPFLFGWCPRLRAFGES